MKKRIALMLAFVSVAVLTISFAQLYFFSPGKIVVNRYGDVNGLVNEVRRYLQGNRRFYEDQLRLASTIRGDAERGSAYAAQRYAREDAKSGDTRRREIENQERILKRTLSDAELKSFNLLHQSENMAIEAGKVLVEDARAKRIVELYVIEAALAEIVRDLR